jgi:hypothetical protein
VAFDIRGLPLIDEALAVRAVDPALPPAGFVGDRDYRVLSIAVDCLPASPVLYLLLADGNGRLRATKADDFRLSKLTRIGSES